MTFNINFDLCAIVINTFLMYILVNRKDMSRNYNKVFLVQMVCALLSCVFDILSATAIMNKNFSKLAIASFTSFYNLFHSFIPFMYVLYVILLTGVILKEKNEKIRIFCVSIPIIIIVGLLSVNGIYHFVFSIDDNLEYHREPMLYFIYICAFLYIIQGVYYLIRYGAAISSKKKLSIYLLIVFSIGSIIFQAFFTSILVELFAEAITSCGILFFTEDGVDVKNPITSIYNKTAFMEDNDIFYNLNREYFVFGIKILDFDRIKLRYGNTNTEKMLNEIAFKLVEIADEESVYELDNGSFAILVVKYSEYKISKLEDNINKMFEKGWNYEKIVIDLMVQVNKIFVPQDADSVTKLINKIQKIQIKLSPESDKIDLKEKNLVHYV
ncbi:histidine kinase N-terminal 7TM domain-containing protein [Lachnobacterium bovis]|uniref:GGDEF domain-containing protein, diguanylate cyclase (C-di-GMP synthetase) or its enzymatically inactive variants n=1 Tax=Lachnobacterium bovis DSM 14045 TaxID=1122142 RepID=A0A1H3FBU2_9FIRM|nr:diguanylate cyclase [Lachnobacterium bovis]SDX87619.1 GGDEF domain-containing protein, diguanylate cyclase (c-di-GMP synthetase) or its enzymatically inactive variants [Lachnobacterium bovis DSM 14045]